MLNAKDSWYDVAQVCLNGHMVNDATKAVPKNNNKFCGQCGAPTITQCPKCNSDLRGYYHDESDLTLLGMSTSVPGQLTSFCIECGAPFPWTESKLQAARDLVQELDELKPEDKDILTKSLDELVSDTPRTQLAATRFKRIASKAGIEGAGALKSILVDIISETAKNMIWPTP